MENFRTLETQCPHCGHLVDTCSSFTEQAAPKPGDLSVCINCMEVVKFDENLNLQKLGEEEIFQIILKDPEAYTGIQTARQVILDSQEEGQV